MFWIIAGTIAVMLVVRLAVQHWHYRQSVNQFIGPETWLFSNRHQCQPHQIEEVMAYEQTLSVGAYRLWLLPWLGAIMVRHPRCLAQVLKGQNIPKSWLAYNAIRAWLGNGLLLANGKQWARNRRLLTPGFHFEILKPYVEIYNDAANILVDKWTNRSSDNFDIMNDISHMTLDVVLRCAMSQTSECQTSSENLPYVDAVFDLAVISVYRLFNPLYQNDTLYKLFPQGRKFFLALKTLHKHSEQIIQERRQFLEENPDSEPRKYRDFLDILLTAVDSDGKGLTDREIRDEVDTFMFEGHDTTAHGIAWTLYLLGLHPECQERCREEIDSILGDEERDFTWEDVDKLKYTHMCIREAMRLYPPVPVVIRELAESLEIDGKTVLPGTMVIIDIVGVHRNREVFPDPLEYRPERFSAEASKDRDPFAYIPFSAGSRNCIGQTFASLEERITIAKILRKLVIKTDADHKIKLMSALVLRSTTGIQLSVCKRNDY